MKKIAAIVLTLILSLGAFASCTPGEGSQGTGDGSQGTGKSVTGLDAVRLLLANERLDADQLKDSESVFSAGLDALENLAYLTAENFDNTVSDPTFMLLSQTDTSAQRYTTGDGSSVEVNGNVYTWRDFSESSNSYEYFKNLTGNIISSSEAGAELIDYIKKNVRVLDKWVDFDGVRYYLHVEANTELLLCNDTVSNELQGCTRTKNEKGSNVYEVFYKNDLGESRMVYIPGEMCEYTYQANDGFDHNFLATNTKGYWEVVDVNSPVDGEYNVSCMVLKEDCCIDAFYTPATQRADFIKLISADKKTDLFFYMSDGGSALIDLQLQGFNGVDRVELEVDDPGALYYSNEDGKTVYATTGEPYPTVVTENGTRISHGDTFVGGRVTVISSYVTHYWYGGSGSYVPTLSILVDGVGHTENIQLLQAFLAEVGLECRRDFGYITDALIQAQDELAQFARYQMWNESKITTKADIARGYENRDAKFKAWNDEFDAVKDAEIIDGSDVQSMELNAHLANVTAEGSATLDALNVSVKSISVTMSDTLLLVENEKYTISFALCDAEGRLILIDYTGKTVAYTGEKTFTVSGADVALSLPILNEGSYVPVAFVTTADGIRSSGYIPVKFSSVTNTENIAAASDVSFAKANDGTLTVKYSARSDVKVDIAIDGSCSYEAMYNALAQEAYRYGFVDSGAIVERLGADGEWNTLEGDETALESGTYRLSYSVHNGDSVTHGVVYTEYTVK
ncbi:MAG: hypothetical protein IJX74_03230 [Clostridia bacterium]|nr:hypothetical protein [Clostridia bacterium]